MALANPRNYIHVRGALGVPKLAVHYFDGELYMFRDNKFEIDERTIKCTYEIEARLGSIQQPEVKFDKSSTNAVLLQEMD